MRTVQLIQVGAQAELLRLKELVARTIKRTFFALFMIIFVVSLFVCLHVLLASWLSPHVGAAYATLIVSAGDLLLAIVFGLLAAISSPGKIEQDAFQIRETARKQLMDAVTTASTVAVTSSLLRNRSIFRIIITALAGKMITAAVKR